MASVLVLSNSETGSFSRDNTTFPHCFGDRFCHLTSLTWQTWRQEVVNQVSPRQPTDGSYSFTYTGTNTALKPESLRYCLLLFCTSNLPLHKRLGQQHADMQLDCRGTYVGHTCFNLGRNSALKWLICKLVHWAQKCGFKDWSMHRPSCVLASWLILQRGRNQMQNNCAFCSMFHQSWSPTVLMSCSIDTAVHLAGISPTVHTTNCSTSHKNCEKSTQKEQVAPSTSILLTGIFSSWNVNA